MVAQAVRIAHTHRSAEVSPLSAASNATRAAYIRHSRKLVDE
jgi:hypothetical protein